MDWWEGSNFGASRSNVEMKVRYSCGFDYIGRRLLAPRHEINNMAKLNNPAISILTIKEHDLRIRVLYHAFLMNDLEKLLTSSQQKVSQILTCCRYPSYVTTIDRQYTCIWNGVVNTCVGLILNVFVPGARASVRVVWTRVAIGWVVCCCRASVTTDTGADAEACTSAPVSVPVSGYIDLSTVHALPRRECQCVWTRHRALHGIW